MKFLIVFLCMLLCSCSNNSSLDDELDAIFEEESSSYRINNYSDYINYYLPSDVNEVSFDDTSLTLEYGDDKIIININIAGIINSYYYQDEGLNDDGFFSDDNLVYEKEGNYIDVRSNEEQYLFKIYEYDNRYLLHMLTKDLNIYAYANDNLVALTSKIYLFIKSAAVDEGDVVLTYSYKDVVDYEKKTINLFEKIVPVSGRIDELLTDE